jgi:hypothetical protein
MCDNNKLRITAVIFQIPGHSIYISFIQGRINFIDQTKRSRPISQES